jgi:hypothetical protein
MAFVGFDKSRSRAGLYLLNNVRKHPAYHAIFTGDPFYAISNAFCPGANFQCMKFNEK